MANISTIADLVINTLSQSKYEQLCASGQLDPFQLYITDDDRSNALSNKIQELSNQLTSYYEKTETSSSSQINGAFAGLSNEYQVKGEYLTAESDPLFTAVSSTFLTSVPADYKTYGNTVSSLSNDGYATIDSVSKVFVKDSSVSAYENGKKCDLSVVKLTNEEYAQLLSSSTTQPNALYVISSNYNDAYGQQIKNVATGIELSDAVNVEQLQSISSAIPLSTSQLQNDAGFISSVPSAYKTYDETTSSLSNDGYVTQSNIATTLGSIAISAFSEISSPGSSVRSIQQTLDSILSILKRLA